MSWRAATPQQAAELLDDKEIYGILELTPPAPGARFAPTAVVSGALNLFRFSTETLRSLLFLDGSAPDVSTGIVVFASIAVVGLAVLLWPARKKGDDGAPVAAQSSPRVAVG